MIDRFRNTGRTTRQILNAPVNSIFVVRWHHGIRATKDWATRIGRDDIDVWAANQVMRLRGKRPIAFVVDHSVTLTNEERDYMYACGAPVITYHGKAPPGWMDLYSEALTHVRKTG